MAPVERDGAWYAGIAQAAGQALVVVDLDGQVVFWNAAAERLHGWSAGEVRSGAYGDTLDALFGPAFTARLPGVFADHGEASDVHLVRHRDGHAQWVSVVATPLRDEGGAIVGVVQAHTDVTDTHRTAELGGIDASHRAAIAAVSRRALDGASFAELMDAAVANIASELGVPLVTLLELDETREHLVLRAGVGWDDGLIGSTTLSTTGARLPGFVIGKDRVVVVEDWRIERRFERPELYADAGIVSSMSTELRGRGATVGVLSAHATEQRPFSVVDADYLHAIGRILGAAIARDAIDQQLGATIQRLQRSEEIRVSFLRATSHELRTPLTVIAGVAETLQHHQDHLEPSQRRELLDRLTTNTDRLQRLIGDLLDVDRLASGLVVARRSAHDLRELVERVVGESEYDTHRITLELEPVTAEVDVPKLERVVANLVANAVRHTPEGTAITVRLGRQGPDAWLRVEDDGPGIDPHHLERIFEPFVQGRDRHHHAQPGTGLGLALAREIVQLHGGDIRADNRPEGGARFEVTLPVDDTSRDAPDTPGR